MERKLDWPKYRIEKVSTEYGCETTSVTYEVQRLSKGEEKWKLVCVHNDLDLATSVAQRYLETDFRMSLKRIYREVMEEF